jgi:hypothetical protein
MPAADNWSAFAAHVSRKSDGAPLGGGAPGTPCAGVPIGVDENQRLTCQAQRPSASKTVRTSWPTR